MRQFSDEAVTKDVLQNAIRIAQKTPSVCNRQSSKVWVVLNKETIRQVLDIGGGAAGFGEQIQAVLIVTSDLTSFISAGERYQCWIDGGMFAMSLIYALHSKGIVSCCMNWSKEYSVDTQLRKVLKIHQSGNIIMLIGVGYPRDSYSVSKSARKPIHEVVEFCD